MKANELLLSTYKRSDQWPKVKKKHLLLNPRCAACESRKNKVAHHIKPFHLFPELELDPENLVTLCNKGHHLLFGHLMDYMSYNMNVLTDVAIWNERIKYRPNKKRLLR